MARTAAGNRQLVRDFGTCLLMDGVNDTVKVTSVAAQNGLTATSVSAWVNLRGLGENSTGRIFQKGGFGVVNRLIVAAEAPNRIVVFVDWNNGGSILARWNSPSNSLSLRSWIHVVVTYDSSSTSNDPIIYINGVSQTVSEVTAPLGSRVADDAVLTIGCRSDDLRTLDGYIDEVQWYNKVLSQAEVTELYYRGTAASGIVGYWKFNEGSGSTATDSTGNANGAIVGATYSTDVFIKPRTTAGSRFLVRDFGTCLKFDGSSTDVTVTSQLCYQNTGYTISLWFKCYPQNDKRFFALGSTSSNNQVFGIGTGASGQGVTKKIKVFIRDDSNNPKLGISGTASNGEYFDGNWHHLVWIDNNGTCSLYVDNQLDSANFNYTRSGTFTFNRTGLGALVRAAISGYMTGFLDDIRIWNNSVLSSTDVANLFYRGVNPSTPTSWYKFDEGSGTTATDSGSLATNGTITAATYSTDVFIKPRTVVT